MGHIFISYSHQDGDYARQLADRLQNAGFEVWFDERIDYGDRWFRTIVQAIRAADAVIVLMTPEAEASEWIEREILVAQKHEKPIFPVLLHGQAFDLLITTQYADMRGGTLPDEDFFARLGQNVVRSPQPPSSAQEYQPPQHYSGPALVAKRREIAVALVQYLERTRDPQHMINPSKSDAYYTLRAGLCNIGMRLETNDRLPENHVILIISVSIDINDTHRQNWLTNRGYTTRSSSLTRRRLYAAEFNLPQYGELPVDTINDITEQVLEINELMGTPLAEITVTRVSKP